MMPSSDVGLAVHLTRLVASIARTPVKALIAMAS